MEVTHPGDSTAHPIFIYNLPVKIVPAFEAQKISANVCRFGSTLRQINFNVETLYATDFERKCTLDKRIYSEAEKRNRS
ncbi:MAG: hypothetical protein JWP81_821 [Ferruginibacter sp.]|nr:hypothetical protein [Ferruginibacter sp.]